MSLPDPNRYADKPDVEARGNGEYYIRFKYGCNPERCIELRGVKGDWGRYPSGTTPERWQIDHADKMLDAHRRRERWAAVEQEEQRLQRDKKLKQERRAKDRERCEKKAPKPPRWPW